MKKTKTEMIKNNIKDTKYPSLWTYILGDHIICHVNQKTLWGMKGYY